MRDSRIRLVCDRCGEPAVCSEKEPDGNDFCEGCARTLGAEHDGEAWTSLETLAFVISRARSAGATSDQLREAFEVLLRDDGDVPDMDSAFEALGNLGCGERPWMRTFHALREVVA